MAQYCQALIVLQGNVILQCEVIIYLTVEGLLDGFASHVHLLVIHLVNAMLYMNA